MGKKLLLVYLLSFWGVNAQIKNVSIVSTNNLSISEQEQLSKLIFMLNGKNNKYANNYVFTFESLLWDDGKVNIKNGFNFNLLLDFNENKKFNNQELEIDEINTLTKSTFLIQFNQNSNLKYDSNNNLDNIDDLVKLIRKTKSKNITILFNNGFKPFIFSTENINSNLNDKKKKNRTSDLIPHIIMPNRDNRDLRPDETHYYIVFDSVGIFPSYEIEIYRKYSIGQDISGNTIYDSLLFIKECVQFIDINEFNSNKKKINIALYSEYDSKCKIAIKADFIANVCYQLEKKVNTDEIKDEDCGQCRYDCLYSKKFTLLIKGCAPGIKEDRIPNGYLDTPYFLFQCIKKS